MYDELRKLAAARMAAERPGHTLDATALVHEAYLRLVGRPAVRRPRPTSSPPPPRPCAASSSTTPADTRPTSGAAGGNGSRWTRRHRVTDSPEGLLALDDALTRLAAEEPRKAELVELRFFAGLTMPEAAAALGISLATAERLVAVRPHLAVRRTSGTKTIPPAG